MRVRIIQLRNKFVQIPHNYVRKGKDGVDGAEKDKDAVLEGNGHFEIRH